MVDCERIGYRSGLAAGLGAALADLDDTDLVAAARGGFAAVPAERVPDGARIVDHRLAAEEGVAIMDVRLPPGLVPLRHAGDHPETIGLRLAAVRIGLLRRVLDHAGADLDALRHQLAAHPPVVAVHARLTELGRRLSPARALSVAELVAATWIGS